MLPLNVPQEFLDAQAQGRQVLTNVNDVIRYNRLLMSPIQKVGEPTDVLYREEAITNCRLIATYAFQAALAEAKLLAAYEKLRPGQQTNGASSAGDEAEKLERAVSNVSTRIANLKIQEKVLSEQVQKATPSQLPIWTQIGPLALRARLAKPNIHGRLSSERGLENGSLTRKRCCDEYFDWLRLLRIGVIMEKR